MTNVYSTALRLAATGRPVFPCRPGTKNPLVKWGHAATTDAAVIAEWEWRWPRANLAMPTGLRSGLVVVDLDLKDGRDGFASLAAVEERLGALPATVTVKTPTGGEHRYFRMPVVSIRNAAGRIGELEAPGIDVRGDGGLVIVPPSVINARAYVRRDGVAVAAALPEAWASAMARVRKHEPEPSAQEQPLPENVGTRGVARWCLRAVQGEVRALVTTGSGARNDRLWRAAAALGGLVHVGVFDVADVRHALEWACIQWGDRTPKKDTDTLERGLAFGLAHPRVVKLGVGHVRIERCA